jgi:Leucine-rich repeat (LRR) protein
LTGNIPEGIFGLKSLVLLDLDNNLLNGVISRRVAELTNIQFLTIGNNRFDRQEVPLAISALSRLSKITFSSHTTDLV